MKRRIDLGVLPTSGMRRAELVIDTERLNLIAMKARMNDGKTTFAHGAFTVMLLPASDRQLAAAEQIPATIGGAR